MPKAKSFQVGSEALARKAAVEVAGSVAVGNFLEEVDEGKGLATYLFESRHKGYVGWRWSVTIFQQTAKSTPTVSEVLMVPGPEAILAPAWVPWSERLADYKALQAELEAQAALDLEESAYDEDDEADSETLLKKLAFGCLRNLSQLQRERGQLNEFTEASSKALNLDPSDVELWKQLGL